MRSSTDDLGSGSIKGLLLKLSVPTITAQIINALYNIVDRIYIGRISVNGDLALTGLGLCFPIIMVVMAFASLFGAGGANIAGIAMGSGDNKRAEKLLGNSVFMLVVSAIIITSVVLIFKVPMLYFIGASDNTISFAVDYLDIYILGSISVLISLGLNYYINTQGFTKFGMATVLIGAVLNIILDPIFIYIFDLGVKGAALATIISQTVSAIWVLKFLIGKKTKLRLRKENLKPDSRLIKSMASLGVSPFVMMSTESLISITFNSSLQSYGGDIAVGAMTVLSSVLQFVSLPIQGLTQGAQPITSYNYGARNYERVKETFFILLKSAIAMTFIMWLFIMTCTKYIVGFFTTNDALIQFTIPALRIYLFMTVFLGIQMACQQTFLATGQAKISLFLALLRKIILLIPLALILGRIFGTTGVFVAEPIADFLAASVTFTLFMKRRKITFGEK